MSLDQVPALRQLEGHRISLSLIGGARVDDCELVSAARHPDGTLWLYCGSDDQFVRVADVLDCWETPGVKAAR